MAYLLPQLCSSGGNIAFRHVSCIGIIYYMYIKRKRNKILL